MSIFLYCASFGEPIFFPGCAVPFMSVHVAPVLPTRRGRNIVRAHTYYSVMRREREAKKCVRRRLPSSYEIVVVICKF